MRDRITRISEEWEMECEMGGFISNVLVSFLTLGAFKKLQGLER
jgi:hypothetical protein